MARYFHLKQNMSVRVKTYFNFTTNKSESILNKRVRPPVVSTYDYINSQYKNDNRLDKLLSLIYNVN